MLEVKLVEARDDGITMALMFVKMAPDNPSEKWLLARSGYGDCPEEYIIMVDINEGDNFKGQTSASETDYAYGFRTRTVVHHFMEDNWDTVKPGDVVDVQYILGETSSPKKSEQFHSILQIHNSSIGQSSSPE